MIVVAGISLPILTYAGVLKVTGNIDTVEDDAVYRSGQLSGERLAQLIADRHLRTVINLRGSHPGARWYDDEVKASADANVLHIDLPMSATREPDPALLGQLIDALQTAPKPFLIHCESGSDRTGLASALYRLLALGQPPEVAARQLSFNWGHFPWLGSPTIAMDRTFDKVAAGIRVARAN